MWAGIWRKPVRSILTLLSVVNAFLLFGILQGFASGLDHAVAETHADMLLSFSRISQIEPLPIAEIAQIKMVPGVRAITPLLVFPATYRAPTQFVPAQAVDASQDQSRGARPCDPPEHDRPSARNAFGRLSFVIASRTAMAGRSASVCRCARSPC